MEPAQIYIPDPPYNVNYTSTKDALTIKNDSRGTILPISLPIFWNIFMYPAGAPYIFVAHPGFNFWTAFKEATT